MSKYNLTDLYEGMSDEEFAGAQAFDRLSKDDQDKLAMIKQMMAKEKSMANIKRMNPKADSKSLEKLSKMEEDLFSKDGGSEDNVDNIDKVASPSAKGTGYGAAVSSNRSEDGKEQSDVTQTTKPMYTENKKMSLMDLAKKLGIDVDELEAKVKSFKGKEDDAIEASAKKSMAEENDEEKMPMDEVRVDRETSERIEGLLDISMKAKFIDAFMDIYEDLLEEDNFFPEDIINHLNNEMHAELAGYQRQGDKLAGLEENGEVKDYSEELSEGAYKDFIMQAREAYSQSEVEAYMDSVNNDMRLNGSDQYDDFDVEDYLEDFRNYVDDKMGDVREHFSRFK
tara:strand:+ start:627 stop:1643 length:1017 start_codon:yes stop_codon:yes gene_type:complete